jgi:hypothetical protein
MAWIRISIFVLAGIVTPSSVRGFAVTLLMNGTGECTLMTSFRNIDIYFSNGRSSL